MLIEFLKAINTSKTNPIREAYDPSEAEKEYKPFIINRFMSYHIDTILFANDMNMFSNLDPQMQFEYYLHAVRNRKRFAKWMKPEKVEDIELIKEYFRYNSIRAREVLPLLSEKDLDYIRMKCDNGESRKEKKKKVT